MGAWRIRSRKDRGGQLIKFEYDPETSPEPARQGPKMVWHGGAAVVGGERIMEDLPVGQFISMLGFGLGMLFGAIAHRTSFCTMGALSDIVFMGNWNRFRAWMLAIAVAMLGSQYMYQSGQIDLSRAIYLTPNFGWFGAILGGLMFGFGMTLGSGCGNKTLVRVGAGNLKSLVVMLFLGIFAYMTLRGLIGLARIEMESLTMIDLAASGFKTQGIPELLTAVTPMGLETASLAATLLIGGGLLVFCFKSADFRSSPLDISSGFLIGVLVVIAWYVTGVLGADDFDPVAVESFTFISPVGNGIQYLMTFTGATINFGIAAVGGIIFGSFISARARGEFRIESFSDSPDMIRHIAGGSLMGAGGVLALGCTIGQGITGMSTLAFGSLLALVSIIAGALFGFKYLEEESLGGALKLMFGRG